MEIEELAFGNRENLTHLNKPDLLDIIEILQNDRIQWINQFSKTHNESVEIQKENQELKKQLEECKSTIKVLSQELTKDKTLKQDYLTTCCGIPIGDIPKLIIQQKEFIKYLEDEIKTQEKDILETIEEMDVYVKQMESLKTEEILQKYKEIIGENDV